MPDALTAAPPSVAAESATKAERIDFLKQTIAFNEANVRAYDLKAQISLAAFVLSGNPIMAVINGTCGTGARTVLVISLVVYVLTILIFMLVLWPVAPSNPKLTEGLGAKGLFYLPDPLGAGGSRYAERLQGLVVEPELTAEALKLSYIRTVKARRFKNALIATVGAYLAITATFLAIGRCAF